MHLPEEVVAAQKGRQAAQLVASIVRALGIFAGGKNSRMAGDGYRFDLLDVAPASVFEMTFLAFIQETGRAEKGDNRCTGLFIFKGAGLAPAAM